MSNGGFSLPPATPGFYEPTMLHQVNAHFDSLGTLPGEDLLRPFLFSDLLCSAYPHLNLV
jgi:hypothetical protein